MNILTCQQFMERKQHDRIAIMGSGYSINTVSPRMWGAIQNDMDQFAMNWYCHSGKNVTFYLVREQCVSAKRCLVGSSIEDFVSMVNSIKTTMVVKDKGNRFNANNGSRSCDTYLHTENIDRFSNDGIILKENRGKAIVENFDDDIFSNGLYHGKCTMYDTLHFAVGMGYKAICFFGVDLYDYRYFWLPYGETHPEVLSDGKVCSDQHTQAARTVGLVSDFVKTYPQISLEVHNPKSLLSKVVKVMGAA